MARAKTHQPKDPKHHTDSSSLAYEIRTTLVEGIRLYMHGKSEQSDVLRLARQLTPDAERSGDHMLAAIVDALGKMRPGQLIQGYSVDRLIRTAINALLP